MTKSQKKGCKFKSKIKVLKMIISSVIKLLYKMILNPYGRSSILKKKIKMD